MPRFPLISRRTCLKGLGVSLALPLLETMSWAGTPAGGGAQQPVRLLFFNWRFGVVANRFWPKDERSYNASVALPPTLEPLRPVIGETLLIGQTKNPCQNPPLSQGGPAEHAAEVCSWLTCAKAIKTGSGTVNIGISADQLAAEQLGQFTALPSLELGLAWAPLDGINEHGYARAYESSLSYRSATQPVPRETDPRAVLNRLFSSRRSAPQHRGAGPTVDAKKFAADPAAAAAEAGAGTGPSLDQMMIDQVMDNAKDLRKHVSTTDQRTLDEYLDGIQALEKRIVAIERQQAEAARSQGGRKSSGTFSDPITVTMPKDGATFSERFRVMADLMILGFQSDVMRVGSFGNLGERFEELGFQDDHHSLTHEDPNGTSEKLMKCLKIEHLHMQQITYLIQRAKDLKDGNGSLLDHSIMLFGTGMGEGIRHNNDDYPVIIAGRGNGTVRPGRYVTQAKGTQGDLLMGLLARAGCTVPKQFGLNGTKLSPDLS